MASIYESEQTPTNDLEIGFELIIGGHHREYQRRKGIEETCNHFTFGSPQDFILWVDRCHKRNRDPDNQADYEKELDKLSRGCCKQCTMFIIANLIEFWRERGPHCPFPIEYFMRCLYRFQFARIIFKRQSLWKLMFTSITATMEEAVREQQWLTTLKLQQFLSKDDIDGLGVELYQNISVFMFQVIRNMFLWKRKHFEHVLEKHIWKWLSFVADELQKGLYVHYPDGISCVLVFFVFTVFAIHRMQSIHKTKRYQKRLDLWFERLKEIQLQYPSQESWNGRRIESFVALKDPRRVKTLHVAYCKMVSEVSALKWSNVRCQNSRCGLLRERKSDGKLYKCKSCGVARYCSRMCQKYDWKTHKPLCRKLNKMC